MHAFTIVVTVESCSHASRRSDNTPTKAGQCPGIAQQAFRFPLQRPYHEGKRKAKHGDKQPWEQTNLSGGTVDMKWGGGGAEGSSGARDKGA